MPRQGVRLRRLRAQLRHPRRRGAQRARAHVPELRQHRPVDRDRGARPPHRDARHGAGQGRRLAAQERQRRFLSHRRLSAASRRRPAVAFGTLDACCKAVTFDFWNTLFVDVHGQDRERRRAEIAARRARGARTRRPADGARRRPARRLRLLRPRLDRRAPHALVRRARRQHPRGARRARPRGRPRAPRRALRAARARPAAGAHAGRRRTRCRCWPSATVSPSSATPATRRAACFASCWSATACWPTSSTCSSPTSTA